MFKANVATNLVTRFFLILAAVCTLFLVGIFTPASVHAAPMHAAPMHAAHPDSCDFATDKCYVDGSGCTGVVLVGYQPVYDSYNHLEGTIRLHASTSCQTVWGTFLSNTNTWQRVMVYTEPTYYTGWSNSPWEGWAVNTNFDAPMYLGPDTYFAEVNLIDNRGTSIWKSSGNFKVCFPGDIGC